MHVYFKGKCHKIIPTLFLLNRSEQKKKTQNLQRLKNTGMSGQGQKGCRKGAGLGCTGRKRVRLGCTGRKRVKVGYTGKKRMKIGDPGRKRVRVGCTYRKGENGLDW
jgi:hypothetical protein